MAEYNGEKKKGIILQVKSNMCECGLDKEKFPVTQKHD